MAEARVTFTVDVRGLDAVRGLVFNLQVARLALGWNELVARRQLPRVFPQDDPADTRCNLFSLTPPDLHSRDCGESPPPDPVG